MISYCMVRELVFPALIDTVPQADINRVDDEICRMPLNPLLQIGKQVIVRIIHCFPKSFSHQKTANLSGMASCVK